MSYHSFKNVDNIKGCIMSILNSKIREDRRNRWAGAGFRGGWPGGGFGGFRVSGRPGAGLGVSGFQGGPGRVWGFQGVGGS